MNYSILKKAGLALSISFALSAQANEFKSIQLDLPAQAADTALIELAEKSGVQIVFDPMQVEGINTLAVTGYFTLSEALSSMLRGTSLVHQRKSDNLIVVKEVSGSGSVGELDEKNNKRMIEEMVVTAQKREQNLRDVPISIAAMTGQKMENAGIEDLTELSYSVPGLSVYSPGPGIQSLIIRGVSNGRGGNSLIGMYLDEASVAGANEAQLDLKMLDMERVEVLKGPQGTLYGGGSAGGTIRYITRNPDLEEFSGELGFSVADTSKGGISNEVTGILNIPVVESVFGVRIAVAHDDDAGWINQPTANREDINNSDQTYARVKALWRPTEMLDIQGTVIVNRNDGDGYNIVNRDVEKSIYAPAVNEDQIFPYYNDYEHYALTASYDMGFATLMSVSAYTNLDKAILSNFEIHSLADLNDFQGFVALGDAQIDIFTQELRLTSNGDGKLHWTAGAFYRDYEGTDAATNYYDLGSYLTGSNLFIYGTDVTDGQESIALFGDIEYAVTDRVTVGTGVRYFEEDRTRKESLLGISRTGTSNDVSPRFFLSYVLMDDINVYLNVSKGFRSGGLNSEQAILIGAPKTYDPETVWNYEVGTKMSLLDSRLNIELALYYSDYDDYIGIGQVANGFLVNQTFNAGKAEIKGIDFLMDWAVLDNLTLGFNANILDEELVEVNIVNPPAIAGDSVGNVPKWSFSVYMDSTFNWTDAVPGYFRANYNRQDEMFFYSRNSVHRNLQGELFDYSDIIGFLGMSLGVELDKWKVELYGTNLLDETGALNAWPSWGTHYQMRPRTIGLKARMNF